MQDWLEIMFTPAPAEALLVPVSDGHLRPVHNGGVWWTSWQVWGALGSEEGKTNCAELRVTLLFFHVPAPSPLLTQP